MRINVGRTALGLTELGPFQGHAQLRTPGGSADGRRRRPVSIISTASSVSIVPCPRFVIGSTFTMKSRDLHVAPSRQPYCPLWRYAAVTSRSVVSMVIAEEQLAAAVDRWQTFATWKTIDGLKGLPVTGR
jgi:hypothetical protein